MKIERTKFFEFVRPEIIAREECKTVSEHWHTCPLVAVREKFPLAPKTLVETGDQRLKGVATLVLVSK